LIHQVISLLSPIAPSPPLLEFYVISVPVCSLLSPPETAMFFSCLPPLLPLFFFLGLLRLVHQREKLLTPLVQSLNSVHEYFPPLTTPVASTFSPPAVQGPPVRYAAPCHEDIYIFFSRMTVVQPSPPLFPCFSVFLVEVFFPYNEKCLSIFWFLFIPHPRPPRPSPLYRHPHAMRFPPGLFWRRGERAKIQSFFGFSFSF